MFVLEFLAVEALPVDRVEAHGLVEASGGLVVVNRGNKSGIGTDFSQPLQALVHYGLAPSPLPLYACLVPSGSKRPVRLGEPHQQMQ